MRILVIDGQGGRLGRSIIEALLKEPIAAEIIAVGTNAAAAAAMIRDLPVRGASGENPVIVGCRDADVIVGPIGILAADAMLGEITPAMARAVGQSRAEKVLIPVSRCSITIAGAGSRKISEYLEDAVAAIKKLIG